MATPEIIIRLIERFRDNYDSCKSPAYNETQARREFIDPLFKVLGWDVDNAMNFSEQFKEVVHEDAIKIGGATKTPDYSFRLGGRCLLHAFICIVKNTLGKLLENKTPQGVAWHTETGILSNI